MLGREVSQDVLVDRIPMIGADMHETESGCDDMSVEFFPDRPDLYSVEGLARGMRAFLDIEPGMKTYEVGESGIDVYIDESVKSVRPYFLCGVVTGVDIDDNLLRSMMELQEKLHITIGRKRSKLAIGIHDMDKVEAPFTYRLADPHEVSFVPLAKTQEMDMDEILRVHEKGKDYAHLLEGMTRYPVIQDKDGRVLSFPPIINGALTAVTVGRRNLFIDVTGNDRKAVKGALDIVCTALAERGGKILAVRMHEDGRTFASPDLSPSSMDVSASECDRFLGLGLGPEGTCECLRRMGMDAYSEGDTVHVTYPSVRLDIMHKVDIFEDVATGYGFDRFGGKYSLDQTSGGLEPVTTFSDSIRDIAIGLGYTEVNTLTLSSDREEFVLSGLPRLDNVRVLNPITEDHTCLRSYLMPSLIRILKRNKHRDLPQKIFEIGYVVRDGKTEPHLCIMCTASKTPFTEMKSVAEGVLKEMGCEHELRPCDWPVFIDGRGAEVMMDGEPIGFFGEMSPAVVVGYELTHPVMFAEIDLKPILAKKRNTLFRGDNMDVGDDFPGFTLKDENGDAFDSGSLKGTRYLVFFYSKDNTPGCTKEAVEFTELLDEFAAKGIKVIGVSKDSSESHKRFAESKGLKVKLLSDPDHSLMEAVGAWGKKMNYGKEVVGTIRSTFLVGKDGKVEAAWRNVKAAGHAGRVLEKVRGGTKTV